MQVFGEILTLLQLSTVFVLVTALVTVTVLVTVMVLGGAAEQREDGRTGEKTCGA